MKMLGPVQTDNVIVSITKSIYSKDTKSNKTSLDNKLIWNMIIFSLVVIFNLSNNWQFFTRLLHKMFTKCQKRAVESHYTLKLNIKHKG